MKESHLFTFTHFLPCCVYFLLYPAFVIYSVYLCGRLYNYWYLTSHKYYKRKFFCPITPSLQYCLKVTILRQIIFQRQLYVKRILLYVSSIYKLIQSPMTFCLISITVLKCSESQGYHTSSFPQPCSLFWHKYFHPGRFSEFVEMARFLTVWYFLKHSFILLVLKKQNNKYFFCLF